MAPGAPLRLPQVGRVALCSDAPADGRDPLYLGFRAAGDRLATPGGRHRALKSIFQEAAVPPWWRDRVPLLWRESKGGRELLCVGPFARSPAAQNASLWLHWEPDFAGVKKPDQGFSQRCAD
jgi:tRNA(Ile)-lysidine synthase